MYDVIFHHAMIFDGLGDPPYEGALAVLGDTIAEVGPGVSGSARREVPRREMANV